jgi:Tol biopolymer transport system component
VALVALAGAAVERPASVAAQDSLLRLSYVATAHQLGPVGYRDPQGVVSADGLTLAYAIQQHLYLQAVAGGPIRELATQGRAITDLAWVPDGRLAAREVAFGGLTAEWVAYDITTGASAPLWPAGTRLRAALAGGVVPGMLPAEALPSELRQLAWSRDGSRLAGVVLRGQGSELWVLEGTGWTRASARRSAWRLAWPTWAPDDRDVICSASDGASAFLQRSCGDSSRTEIVAYGPLAFASDGGALYYGAPNERGTLDLWSSAWPNGAARRLTAFARDTYAPAALPGSRVLFKVQDYRVAVAVMPAEGGRSTLLTRFMAETPAWNWGGDSLSVTTGNWRRVVDDAHYPDIAQDIGVVAAGNGPTDRPARLVRDSPSEDQGMHWSPNGRWIAFHSHAGGTDDIYLQRADGSAAPRLLSHGGAETGWPRWSRDGRWIVFPTFIRDAGRGRGRSALQVAEVDQETGAVRAGPQTVPLHGFDGDALQAEWTPDGRSLVFEASLGYGRKAIYAVSRTGGRPRLVHAFASDQIESGIALSPDGRSVVFVAPGADGHTQLWLVPLAGGHARQLTFDPTGKTQPAYSPDGRKLAFTGFSYQVDFWLLGP